LEISAAANYSKNSPNHNLLGGVLEKSLPYSGGAML
jgi:hypothetical protein